jgi:hypothetical protein
MGLDLATLDSILGGESLAPARRDQLSGKEKAPARRWRFGISHSLMYFRDMILSREISEQIWGLAGRGDLAVVAAEEE